MSRLWIKVCGITTQEAIEAAVHAGVDALGFVFHLASPRHLSVAQAAQLAACVPPGVARVAVLLHPSQAELDAALAALRPDFVQTDAGDFAALRLPATQATLPVLRSGAARPDAWPPRFLYESAASGTGQRANWTEASDYCAHGELILAGGLTPATVADAIHAVRPFGVDVSSGVERERGSKDPQRVAAFISAARGASARAELRGDPA